MPHQQGARSASFGSISALVAAFTPTGNGTIWVQSGAASAGITIDGAGNWAAAANFSLTVQGGWNGTFGSTTLDPANPSSTFSDYLEITNWVGPITLKNLTFESVAYNLAYNYQTLKVQTKGNIVLDQVRVNNAVNNNVSYVSNGASLSNEGGKGTITVSNSSFNGNEGYGLNADSSNTLTFKNVSANENGGDGVNLDNSWASTAKTITISNSQFNGNESKGLYVVSGGAVTLKDIVATYNLGTGTIIDNSYLGTVAAPVKVNGVNNFSLNSVHGLEVQSYGAISLSNVTANLNSNRGVYLNNSLMPVNLAAQDVKILGFLTALDNGGPGLSIFSDGAVTAVNLTTSGNGVSGTFIDNTFGTLNKPKPVTLTGTNFFNSNNGTGMNINSHGAVTLSNLVVIDNTGDGVDISNNYNPAKPQNVTIKGSGYFVSNTGNDLNVETFGNVLAANLTATNNSVNGAFIDNATGATLVKPVAITGSNTFNYNGVAGLGVETLGAITLNNLTASHNGMGGALIENNSPAQSKVTLTGYGLFEWNGWGVSYGYGLDINSNGSISAANLQANHNYSGGAILNTIGVSGPQTVTLSGTNTFNGNGAGGFGDGLQVWADGNIMVNNLTASYNHGRGAALDNYYNWSLGTFTAFGSVNLTGFGFFNGNITQDGLRVYSHGNVSLNRVSANYNGNSLADNGIEIYADGNSTLTCSSAYNNYGAGLYVSDWFGGPVPLLTLKGLSPMATSPMRH